MYFRNEADQKRYDPLYWELSNEAEIARAREWLRERNLLASIPLPQTGRPLSSYAKAVETFCGIKPGALLVALDEHTMTFAEGGLGRITPHGIEPGAATETQFECVLNVTSAADLKSHNISIGFIGNESGSVR